MNKNYEQGLSLAQAVKEGMPAGISIGIMGTPYIHLKAVSDMVHSNDQLFTAAQNCHQEEKGAYTGEISVDMLTSVGATYVILGHSERRAYFAESNQLLAQKVDIALQHGLAPIFCCGEGLEIRKTGTHISFVCDQLVDSLFHLSAEEFAKITIAYEPIWAIGTGMTASAAEAEEMHAAIRDLIAKKYGKDIANQLSILYGGSCKPSNADELFAAPNVDGGLIGGAALNAPDFLALISALNKAKS